MKWSCIIKILEAEKENVEGSNLFNTTKGCTAGGECSAAFGLVGRRGGAAGGLAGGQLVGTSVLLVLFTRRRATGNGLRLTK